jgi:hypothetical protein
MCILVGPIESKIHVSKTEILVSPTNIPDTQLTIYSNIVKSNSNCAMILPFVNPSNMPVVIESTEADSKLFDSIRNQCYPKMDIRTTSMGSLTVSTLAAELPVYRSGHYQYSIVPGLDQLGQLDQNVFDLKNVPELEKLLGMYSKNNFGFLVFILDKGVDYKPFIYTSSVLSDGKLFIPTMHYHTGHTFSEIADDWDHGIWILGSNKGKFSDKVGIFNPLARPAVLELPESNWSVLVPRFAKQTCNIRHVVKIGTHRNRDLRAKVKLF